MIKKTLTIKNKLGLHARAAAKFVSTTAQFASKITITKDSKEINGKSIMGIMMLAASQGTQLDIAFDGEDEQEMSKAIEQLIQDNFGESE